jgi:hypothetical protein
MESFDQWPTTVGNESGLKVRERRDEDGHERHSCRERIEAGMYEAEAIACVSKGMIMLSTQSIHEHRQIPKRQSSTYHIQSARGRS